MVRSVCASPGTAAVLCVLIGCGAEPISRTGDTRFSGDVDFSDGEENVDPETESDDWADTTGDDGPSLGDNPRNTATCNSCHGNSENNAPPRAIYEDDDSTMRRGVGAHQSHLQTSNWHKQVSCNECHLVPTEVSDLEHIDSLGPAEVNFAYLAQSDGAIATFDTSEETCSNYCHGQTLTGGINTQPQWTVVDGSQTFCGTCHGLPPRSPHPQNTGCYNCHPTLNEGLRFINKDLHIDGTVDVIGSLSCDSCHGAEGNPAPPTDTRGRTDTSLVTVGAHRSHLKASNWHAQVGCDACHVVPTSMNDAGHIDSNGNGAELNFGELPRSDGAIPNWDPTAARCTNYCHGQTLSGGINNEPLWTLVNGTQTYCGTCHGLPPSAPHPNNPACADCHPTMDSNLSFNAPERHIDGVVDLNGALACDTCHGSNGEPAPPRDTTGNTARTAVGVGAHRNHLATSNWHAQVLCSDCHIVPATIADPGHTDSALPAELTFGVRANARGATAVWDTFSTTCSNYCHGQTLSGGDNTTPNWVEADGTQATCGSCHSLPPAAPHPSSTQCNQCHPTVDQNMQFIDPGRHIDGIVDFKGNLACDSCHGSGGIPAPPYSVNGDTDTALRGIGAHRAHIQSTSSNWHRDVQCADCHVVPATMNDTGHRDSALPAETNFGAVASSDGASPVWNTDDLTCTNYCHGNTLSGGLNTTPQWTVVDGSQAACGTCHGLPPTSSHPNSSACSLCHPAIDSGLSFSQPSTHIDGQVNYRAQHSSGWTQPSAHGLAFNTSGASVCATCHGADLNGGAADVSCNSCHSGWKTNCTLCHGGLDNTSGGPPYGLRDETARNTAAVGAHTAHLESNIASSPRACTLCHTVPSSAMSVGHIDGIPGAEVNFTGLASGSTYSSNTCTNYCHGDANPSNTTGSVNWTSPWGSTNRCNACHSDWGAKSMSGEHNKHIVKKGYACYRCHADVVDSASSIINIDLHINGTPNVRLFNGGSFNPNGSGGKGSCNPACHGTEDWR